MVRCTCEGKPFWFVRDLFIKLERVIVIPSAVSRVVVLCLLAIAVEQKALTSWLL